jgi:excisionase family DNA binding protein
MTSINLDKVAALVLPRVGRFPILGSVLPRTHVGEKPQLSPWLNVKEAATRARCGIKLIYREVAAKRLQAARVGGRRELRFQAEWIDDWLLTHRVIK